MDRKSDVRIALVFAFRHHDITVDGEWLLQHNRKKCREDMDLKGKRILLTGASSGIGRALAFALSKAGAHMVLVSRDEQRLYTVAEEIRKANLALPEPLVVKCDVTKEDDIRRAIDYCVDRMGGIDVLINNAGVGVYGSFQKTSQTDYADVIKTNFLGAVDCVCQAVDVMHKGSVIVFIASVAGVYGVPYLAAYSASKAAMISFSRSIRAELSERNISVCLVSPGYVDTGFFEKEKQVGGGRRPNGHYMNADRVAKRILKAIKTEQKETVISFPAHLLVFFTRLWPFVNEVTMKLLAKRLKVIEG